MTFPSYFVDEMQEGTFKSFKHKHHFTFKNGFTLMDDEIYYETPFGIFGNLFDTILLKKHLTVLIQKRNQIIKEIAER